MVAYFHAEFLLLRGERNRAAATFRRAEQLSPSGSGGWPRYSLGWIAIGNGDVDLARREFRRAAEYPESDFLNVHATAALAPLTAMVGDHEYAGALADRAVTMAARFPVPGVQIMALVRAGQTHLLSGQDESARPLLARLMALMRQLGTRQFRAEALEMVALLAHRTEDHAYAALCFGAAEAIRAARAEDSGVINVLGSSLESTRNTTRSILGEKKFAQLTRTGAETPASKLIANLHDWLESK
jgi:tetratricopeptide (TPR) repeat protein